MKKLINIAGIYGVLALVSGVFYREFTKFNNFDGSTMLSVTHTHFFVLGAFLFLFLSLFALNSDITEDLKFKRFSLIYNIGFPIMMLMIYIRGILQVLETDLTTGLNAAISGISGISHIIVTVGLVHLFQAFKNVTNKSN